MRWYLLMVMASTMVATVVSATNSTDKKESTQESTCNQPDCLRCHLDTGQCTKCLYVMLKGSRRCQKSCPQGFNTIWAADADYMGRVCQEGSILSLVSGRDVSVIAGAAVGGAVCIGLVVGTLLYAQRRTKANTDNTRRRIPRMWKDKRPNAAEIPCEGAERVEFLAQLNPLRGEVDNFLEMLSETRNRFRVLGHQDGATDTKAKAYRAVVRDLSRVLTLLNRGDDHIRTVPQDWRRLLSWAARVLTRYKRQKAAKEAGIISTLEPLSSGGNSIYMTHRQVQAERLRLVVEGLTNNFNDQKDEDNINVDYVDMAPGLTLSSRTSSTVSLTPMIVEESEDIFNNKMDNTKDDFDKSSEDSGDKGYTSDESPPASLEIVNEDLTFTDSQRDTPKGILRERNNSVIEYIDTFNSINSAMNGNYLSSLEDIKYYKNKENEYFRKLHLPVRESQFVKGSSQRGYNVNSSFKRLNGSGKVKMKVLSKSDKTKAVMKSENKKVEEDIYLSIVRKPVAASKDIYRDDTVDETVVPLPESLRNISPTSERLNNPLLSAVHDNFKNINQNIVCNDSIDPSHGVSSAMNCREEISLNLPIPRCDPSQGVPSPMNCRKEISMNLPIPRCELTTEL